MEELRFVITPNCNLNCFFCHREGYPIKGKILLNKEDYGFLFELCKEKLDFNTCTITGGEPLLRDDLEEILETLALKNARVTLITNGTLLKEKKKILKFISELHVSLPTLDKKSYIKITDGKKKEFENIIRGIREAKRQEVKIKINIPFLKNVNDNFESFLKLYEFCRANNINLRIIEVLNKEHFISTTLIKKWLETFGIKKIYKPKERGARETIYELKNGMEISIINYLCNYASNYNKIELARRCKNFMDFFITYDGKISYCFLNNEYISILKEVKSKNKEATLKKLRLAIAKTGKECPAHIVTNEFKKYYNYFSNKKTFQIPTVYCAIFRNKKVLLLERVEPNLFEFPGGKIEFDETPREAIIREIKEEIGVAIEPNKIKLLDISSAIYQNRFVQQLPLLFATTLDKNIKIKLCSEHKSYKWVKVEDLDKIKNLAISVKCFIPKLRDYEKRC